MSTTTNMAPDVVSKFAPKVAMVRDASDHQILFVDSTVGFTKIMKTIGPKYQQTVLRGGAVTIWVDYERMRFQICPMLLKETLCQTHLQHIMDLPQNFGDEAEDEDDTFEYDSEDDEQPSAMLTNPEASNMPGARLPTDTGVKLTPRKNPAARTSKAKIPRPRNTWLVYRSEKSKQIHESRPGMSAGAISTEVSRMWKEEPDEIKAYYKSLADEEARQHKIRYPEYRYQPSSKRQ